MCLENQQRIRQCTGGAVVNSERDQCLMGNGGDWPVLSGGRVALFKFELSCTLDEDIPQNQEAGCVVGAVLDVFLEHIDAMKICCKPAGDGSAPVFCLLRDYLRPFRGGRDILLLDALEVFGEENIALTPCLGVGVQLGDRAIVA